MSELWLNYTDPAGARRRVRVDAADFVIGRDPSSDLSVSDQRLSRRHARIESFASTFVVSDLGSSNGTELNGSPLDAPRSLTHGDRLDLGGGFLVDVEIETAVRGAAAPQPATPGPPAEAEIPKIWFAIIPMLGLMAFLCAGGGYFLLTKDSAPARSERVEEDEDSTRKTREREPSPTPDDSPSASAPAPPETSTEARKVEVNASKFLQNIALNDPNAFLTSKQSEMVLAKLNSIKNTPNLAENLRNAQRSRSELASAAQNQGLKPQFVAAAALTKLGGAKGDIVATAKTMLPVFADLRISLGNSLGDDNLLMAADFLRREGNRRPSLQTTLEAISKSESAGRINPREIRTIWFLKERGKLADEYFDFALRFLALGALLQNPKDFGVDAEPFPAQ